MIAPKEPPVRYWDAPEHGVSFLGIPKCGSSSVRKLLGVDVNKGWSLAPGSMDLTTFTLLRHPLARMRSAHAECLRRGSFKSENFERFLEEIAIRGFFDEHTRPMSYYFRPVSRVFVLEQDGLSRLRDWIELPGTFNIPHENATPPYAMAPITPAGHAHLNHIYRADFTLYRKYARAGAAGRPPHGRECGGHA